MTARWKYLLSLLGLIAGTAWLAVLASPAQKLKLIACDVGQGDAILSQVGSTQVLVDGGQGSKVLNCLEEYMPFWDREIEVVVLTHPQMDHFGGLIEVFKRYKVGIFLANSLDSGSKGYEVLKTLLGGSSTRVVNPTAGMNIGIGSMHLDILWPTQQFIDNNGIGLARQENGAVLGAFTSKRDANDFSIVAKLSFGDFDALLTGDIGPDVVDDVIKQLLLGGSKDIEYLKIPHHGSKNGLTQGLLNEVEPEVAAISAGANNRYGHPHQQVLDMLDELGVRTLRTDMDGNVMVESDGGSLWVEN